MTFKPYDLATSEIGTYEWAEGSNPRVDAYFDDVGYPTMQDDTAWCAAFVGSMLKRGGFPHTGKLTARSYLDWGTPVDIEDAEPGDVVIFWRGSRNSWQGHVAFFNKREGQNVYVLGGNQRDQVNITPYPEDRILGIRRMRRKTPVQSTTLQATAATGIAGATGVTTALAALDGTAQLVVIGAACVALMGLAWIARERIRKWAAGDR